MKVAVAAALAVAAAAAVVLLVRTGRSDTPTATTVADPRPVRPVRPAPRLMRVTVRRTGTLGAPLQDGAGAPAAGGGVLVAGGLTAGDTSTSEIRVVGARGARRIGTLPVAIHDAAAVHLAGRTYVFGGGDGVTQHDAILRIDPNGGTHVVGRLPAASSDSAAAVIRGTAYIVGGYTGTRWLDTVVAWRPGSRARVVAHLPVPVRYAAVAAAGPTLVVAGGSLPSGAASDAVLALRDGRAPAVRIGRLPQATTHAAAATVRGMVVVVGGRGDAVGTPKATLVGIDLQDRRIATVGRLPAPISDSTAVTTGASILIVGGRAPNGTTAAVLRVTATAHAVQPRTPASVVNVYAADGANQLAPAARRALDRIYVPNSNSNTVDVIDPSTRKIVDHFAVGALPQHVTPAYDLRTLYVLNDAGNSVTPIDPLTGTPRQPIPVDDPYNMYFTPDGRWAIVVAERLHRLDFRDPHTFELHRSVTVPCAGVDHMDFSADGRYALVSCEFSGQMLWVDVQDERVVHTINLRHGGMPQDVKLSPDGRVFYVADMAAGGLWEVDGHGRRIIGFLRTGSGAHGLYPSRDARLLYATNRTGHTVSVISFRTRKIVRTWRIPGGSPDMGGVSADGKVLWVSGRYDAEVYAISTATGRLLARIPVGSGPHGLCVWPQPGRYSLGHTGILR